MAGQKVLLRAAAVAAALATQRGLRCALAFLGGAAPAPRVHKEAWALRGSVAAPGAQAPSVSSMPTALAAGSIAGALVASAAAQAVRRGRRSPTALKVTTRTEWYRKVKRIGGDQAIFDVTVPKPMGVRMQGFPQRKGVGISEVVEGGNTDKINRAVCVDDVPGSGMWVLEGDRILAVNGVDVEDGSVADIVKIVSESESSDVTITLMRNTRKGPIKVVLMPEGFAMTVRRGSRLSSAAEAAAGRELKYGCIDGWCGTCWHRERTTNGIFKPCCDVLTGDWDNVMPLVISPKPEKAGDSDFLNPRGAV